MNDIKQLLENVRDGQISIEDALLELKKAPFDDIGYAKVDHHRRLRQGMAEVIYGAGKTAEQILGIINNMLDNQQDHILITRLSRENVDIISQQFDTVIIENSDSRLNAENKKVSSNKESIVTDRDSIHKKPILEYYPDGRIAIIGGMPEPINKGNIVVACAGTSDIAVAEEAALTAQVYGNEVLRLYDVGVAGLHRLLAHLDEIMKASVIISIAGMEGALTSVIGGLADCPVIGVPTSVGYGASYEGLSALLSMMNSCASGVSVVNIDNGFGAGYLASMINRGK